jgi:hypothetical protein
VRYTSANCVARWVVSTAFSTIKSGLKTFATDSYNPFWQ